MRLILRHGICAAFRNKNNDKATREIAVFVTAHLVPETSQLAGQLGGQFGGQLGGPSGGGRIMSPANDSFRQELKDQMSRQ